MESKPKPTSTGIDMGDLVVRLVKYLLEGLAVAFAAALFPGKPLRFGEIAMLGLTATAVFAVLDYSSQS